MKKMLHLFTLLLLLSPSSFSQQYIPSKENLAAREAFQNDKFGLFIHWGVSSMLGDGEWVMNNRNINVEDYTLLKNAFYPHRFNAKQWVSIAKSAGMKYIVFVSRHHDGFSNWDTRYSDWKITNTPFRRDMMRELAEACREAGMKLGFYYSTLDWSREDYPWETGRTGKGTGRSGESNYASYLSFMKSQLTELLTQYGDVLSIWFDGHWDQTNKEGEKDRSSRIDWKYDEIYGLIHSLQPDCLIGNNHHLAPIPGEDFQMFERDLPGENKAGFSFQKASEELPLETCETMNGSWGYNITDRKYKSTRQIIQLLVGAAGRNANLLLNVGPMPDGTIQQEFADTLAAVGKWLNANGEAVFGTRGGVLVPQKWGVATQNAKKLYLHCFSAPEEKEIRIPIEKRRAETVTLLSSGRSIPFKKEKDQLVIDIGGINFEGPDTVLAVEWK